MNNQFATQYLREEVDPNWLENYMKKLGADESLIQYTLVLIEKGLIKPERALEIMKQTLGLKEDGGAAMGGGSTTGGGVTNGATFTPGNGEQYAAGTRKKKYQEGTFEDDEIAIYDDGEGGTVKIYAKPDGTYYGEASDFDFTAKDDIEMIRKLAMWGYKRLAGGIEEDAPRLAGEPSKTNKQGAKNLNAYSSVGFTKAPSAEAAAKQIKGVEVKELWEGSVPDNIAKFAKRKGISSTVSKIAGWAEKAGKKITGGTAIGKNYDTLILDLGYQDSAIRIEIPERIITVYDQPVRDFNSFEAALRQEGEELNESKAYSRFKKQTALRSKSDQMHEAAKMIYNRLAEITKILEYTSQMKTEILEGEDGVHYKHNTKKVFEKINLQVIEVYSKVKGLK
jgi:hypothetical protein